MKKLVLLGLITIHFSMINAHADDMRFMWNAGSFRPYYDTLHNNFSFDLEALYVRYRISNRISASMNALAVNNIFPLDEDLFYFTVLPVEIAFIPWHYQNMLFVSIYNKMGWQILYNDASGKVTHGFYDAVGVQFLLAPELLLRYALSLSAFVEYNTLNELKVGLGVDLGGMIYYFFYDAGKTKQKEFNKL